MTPEAAAIALTPLPRPLAPIAAAMLPSLVTFRQWRRHFLAPLSLLFPAHPTTTPRELQIDRSIKDLQGLLLAGVSLRSC